MEKWIAIFHGDVRTLFYTFNAHMKNDCNFIKFYIYYPNSSATYISFINIVAHWIFY